MTKTGHMSFHKRYFLELIDDQPDREDVREILDYLTTTGKEYWSACPTPNDDGRCSWHIQEEK